MLGFAVVDHRPPGAIAIWHVTRIGEAANPADGGGRGSNSRRVGHTNAVVIDPAAPGAADTVKALVADRAVILTDRSLAPIPFRHLWRLNRVEHLILQAEHAQMVLARSVEVARAGRRSLVAPEFPPRPTPPVDVDGRSPELRCLECANYLARAWRFWLQTDWERVTRARAGRRAGRVPFLPNELDDPMLAQLPAAFRAALAPEAF